MDSMTSEEGRKYRENFLFSPAYELLIFGLCILAIVIVAHETFFKLQPEILDVLQYVDSIICVIFLTDFVLRICYAPNKLKYLLTWGWLDLLSSIPALEMFRWARFFRVMRILKAIRSLKILASHVTASRIEYVVSLASLVMMTTILTGSVAVLLCESQAAAEYGIEPRIKTGAEAIWWTLVTMTTVGYGDYYPVTPGGRIVAIVLMTVGVGIFATYTGFVTGLLLEPGEEKQNDELEQIHQQLNELRTMLQEISMTQILPEPKSTSTHESRNRDEEIHTLEQQQFYDEIHDSVPSN